MGFEESAGYNEVSVMKRFGNLNINFDSRHPVSTSLIIF